MSRVKRIVTDLGPDATNEFPVDPSENDKLDEFERLWRVKALTLRLDNTIGFENSSEIVGGSWPVGMRKSNAVTTGAVVSAM